MRRGGRIFILLGLVLAVISGVGVFIVLANAEPQPVTVPTTKLVVAFQQVPGRSEISADQIGQVDWPEKVPTPIGAFEQPADVVGMLSLEPIYPGEPIINQMVVSKADAQAHHSNASLVLDKGMVAVSFGVSSSSDVADAIEAGDHIDLIVTYNANTGDTQSPGFSTGVTQKTLENLEILQVGPWPHGNAGDSGGTASSANIVTFAVQEQDAMVLKHIEGSASGYTFVLRAANDDEIFTTEPVTLEYLNKRFKFNLPGLGQ